MEQNCISELDEELNHIDVNSIKLDAIIQLKTWQKKMYSLIEQTYRNRMYEIDSLSSDITNEIKEKQNQIRNLQTDDQTNRLQLKHDIDALKSNIIIHETIPENFHYRIERTVRVSRHDDDQNEEIIDDEPVLVNIDSDEMQVENRIPSTVSVSRQSSMTNGEGQILKVLNSPPVQHGLATGLTKTFVHIGTVAATSTTTVAATTMAKTALIATACGVGTLVYGVGKVTMGTTRKLWSLVASSDE